MASSIRNLNIAALAVGPVTRRRRHVFSLCQCQSNEFSAGIGVRCRVADGGQGCLLISFTSHHDRQAFAEIVERPPLRFGRFWVLVAPMIIIIMLTKLIEQERGEDGQDQAEEGPENNGNDDHRNEQPYCLPQGTVHIITAHVLATTKL